MVRLLLGVEGFASAMNGYESTASGRVGPLGNVGARPSPTPAVTPGNQELVGVLSRSGELTYTDDAG
jgi:hypothetical protein